MSKSRNVYPTWWLLSHMLSHAVAVALNRILLVSSRTMMASNPNLSAVPDRCHVTSSTSLSRCNEPGKSRFSAAFHTCGMELEIHSSRLIGAISRVASRECSQTRDLGSRGLSRSERNGMNGALNRPAFEEQQNLASGRERQSPRYTNSFPEVKRLSSRKRTEGSSRGGLDGFSGPVRSGDAQGSRKAAAQQSPRAALQLDRGDERRDRESSATSSPSDIACRRRQRAREPERGQKGRELEKGEGAGEESK